MLLYIFKLRCFMRENINENKQLLIKLFEVFFQHKNFH